MILRSVSYPSCPCFASLSRLKDEYCVGAGRVLQKLSIRGVARVARRGPGTLSALGALDRGHRAAGGHGAHRLRGLRGERLEVLRGPGKDACSSGHMETQKSPNK